MLKVNDKITINNCFYCQSLGGLSSSPTYGKCEFCGLRNSPLYLVNYEKQKKYFCCGCAWWQYPRSEDEKRAEEEWYKHERIRKINAFYV